MTLRKITASTVTALLWLAFTAPAEAAVPAACFEWTCNANTGACEFDATCSSETPVDYRWTWGDGSPRESILQDPRANHTYGSTVAFTYVTLSVGYLFIGYYDVTCLVQVRSIIGPPQQYFSGTCQ